jgi:integrase
MPISGRLPAFKVGQQWRVNDGELQQWIDSRIRPQNAHEDSGELSHSPHMRRGCGDIPKAEGVIMQDRITVRNLGARKHAKKSNFKNEDLKEQKFERIAKQLYRREYHTVSGELRILYYARFVCKLKRKRRLIPLGSDVCEAKNKLNDIDYENRHCKDFDLDKIQPTSAPDPRREPMTIEKWSAIYLDMEETKNKRSYEREKQLIATVNRMLGSVVLTELRREHLFRYRKQRLQEHIIRAGKPAKPLVSEGTLANELSCLRHMINKAKECDIEVRVPSFAKLTARSQRNRVLNSDEQTKLLNAYPTWLQRVCIVAIETCLSEGDIIRLTKSMVDRQEREIVPAGGRTKTNVEQRAPLTDRVAEILDQIESDKRTGNVAANVNGLIFTRDDGRAITKDMITGAIKRARKRAGVSDFRFHDYRHCAKTQWAREGRPVDAAMLAAGHKSVEMHKRYVNLKAGDVAAAFGLKHV